MLTLSTIKPGYGSKKKKKRVGRGNSSGHGTTATRGQKGQRARAGVSGLKRLGMRSLLLSIPKKRGFNSKKIKPQIINIFQINKNFKDGEIVEPRSLFAKKLIHDFKKPVKILGKGEIKIKIKFKNVALSKKVKQLNNE